MPPVYSALSSVLLLLRKKYESFAQNKQGEVCVCLFMLTDRYKSAAENNYHADYYSEYFYGSIYC